MRRFFAATVAVLLAGLLVNEAAWAQTGKIAGTVRDVATGELLPGVNVVIVGTMKGTTTDGDGYYAILNVKPGTYDVRASFIGFTPQVVEGVRVQIGKTTEVDFRLGEEVIQGEEVVVTAQRPMVEKDLTATSASVSSEQLDALPVQNFQDVVNLQAGVVDGHFRGGRTGEVAYMVDGVPINDVYDNSFAYQVENNAIQEVQIISGTFNAEYGQAQSGVVSIVTKDGGEHYDGSFSAYAGDYLTGDTGLFEHLDQVSPSATYELQGALSGPVVPGSDRVTFFASGRYVRNDGHLFGRRIVRPVSAEPGEGGTYVRVPHREALVFVPALGDSAFVPMDWSEQVTGQLKLTTRLFGSNRFSVNGLVQRDQGQDYDHLFRYNPDGIPTTYGDSWSVTAAYNHVFSATSFAEVRAAFFSNAVDSYVYEDPLDERYPADDALRRLGGNFSFYRGGARMTYFERATETMVGRFDFTSQLTRRHQLKTGGEVRSHRLMLDDFEVKNNAGTDNRPSIPPANTPDHVTYAREPLEAAAYVQDKMEYDYLVINAGVRFDYFNANGEVLQDFGNPSTSLRTDSEAKWQLSPRIGLAYPLSEHGVVHVAYGHFFQMPSFANLYTNADYLYDPEQPARVFGYADLEPEQTVAYELGLQQALSDDIAVDLAIYYKDIRNLLGTRLERIVETDTEQFSDVVYGRYFNRDYGQVKGILAAFERRFTGGFGLNVDYTYQIARGNASDPRDALLDEISGDEPEKQLVPLNWDQRHQLNVRLLLGGTGGAWTATVVGKMGSGLPYTPSQQDQRTGLENSARRPGRTSFDVFATRRFELGGVRPALFARVYNLFDVRNVTNVFTDTGRPQPNLRFRTGEALGLNTKAEFFERPDFYTSPRQVTVGLRVDF